MYSLGTDVDFVLRDIGVPLLQVAQQTNGKKGITAENANDVSWWNNIHAHPEEIFLHGPHYGDFFYAMEYFEKNFAVTIISHQLPDYAHLTDEWLAIRGKGHLDRIYTEDKYEHKFDIFIDDHPKNLLPYMQKHPDALVIQKQVPFRKQVCEHNPDTLVGCIEVIEKELSKNSRGYPHL